MSSLSSLFLPILFLLPALATAADSNTKCYSLTGKELDSSFAPCRSLSSTAKHSGCCATNRTSGADICLDSGLCMATTGKYVGTLWQNGCTDATGKDSGCPKKMCPDATDDTPISSWNIQTCNYGSYCCRSSTDKGSCCSNSTAPKFTTTFLGAIQLPTSTVSISMSTSTATSTPHAIPTTTPAAASVSSPEPVCTKDKSMLVGGAVGGTLGAALIGLLGVILWVHKKEKRQRTLKEHYESQLEQSYALRKTLGSSTLDTREVRTLSEKEMFVSSSDSIYKGSDEGR